MKLSWRDIASTILAIGIVTLMVAKLRNYDWALIGSYRSAIATLGVIGILGMMLSSLDARHLDAVKFALLALAVGAFALLVLGLIFATKVWFVVLAVTMITTWAIATVRHIAHSVSYHRPLHMGV